MEQNRTETERYYTHVPEVTNLIVSENCIHAFIHALLTNSLKLCSIHFSKLSMAAYQPLYIQCSGSSTTTRKMVYNSLIVWEYYIYTFPDCLGRLN